MGKKWKKLWLTRKVAAAKKATQEVVEETNKTTKKAAKKATQEVAEETNKTTKKAAKKKIRWPWGKKKNN